MDFLKSAVVSDKFTISTSYDITPLLLPLYFRPVIQLNAVMQYPSWEVRLRRGREWFVKVFILEINFIVFDFQVLPWETRTRACREPRSTTLSSTKFKMRECGRAGGRPCNRGIGSLKRHARVRDQRGVLNMTSGFCNGFLNA